MAVAGGLDHDLSERRADMVRIAPAVLCREHTYVVPGCGLVYRDQDSRGWRARGIAPEPGLVWTFDIGPYPTKRAAVQAIREETEKQ